MSRSRPAPKSPSERPAQVTWQPHAWRIAALWILSFIAYSNSFEAGFVFDNRTLIVEDARVHAPTAQNLSRILTRAYWPDREASGLYRPLTTLSYLLNYTLSGQHPEGYHWFNFFLHAVNVSLVYALALMIFAAPQPALALAAIWGVHPLLTESVTNIVGRADLLAALGVLAGLLCYWKGQSAEGRRRLAWIAGLAAAQAVGLFSKENAAVLIPLMLLTDLAWPPRSPAAKRAPFYLSAALAVAAYLLARAQLPSHMQVQFTDNPLVAAGFWTARLTAVKVLGRYFFLFFWPASLSPDYSFNAIPIFSWRLTDAVETILIALVCAAGILAAIRWRRTQPPLFFFLLFFFVAIFPTSNLTVLIGSIMAERFTYLPFVGLAGCLVIAIQALSRNRATATPWIAAGLVCAAFAARAYARNSDWQDEASLWTRAVEVCPESAKAHLNLGRVYFEIPGRIPDALAEYETALRIEPDYALAHYNLATALVKVPGRLNDAILHYRAALASEPDYPQAHNNLGTALAQIPGRLPDAITEYKAALRLDPNYAEAHINLANALASVPGTIPEAIAEYHAALEIAPDLAAAHYNLGNVLAETGHLEDAVTEFRLAIKAQPDLSAAHDNLGVALAQIPGRLPEAIGEFESEIRQKPEDVEAHMNLGKALSEIPGRLPDAVTEFESAVRINPQLPAAHYSLGVALAKLPDRNRDAIREFETAYRLRPDPNVERAIAELRRQVR